MVRIKEETKEADAVTSKLFLTSINSWYKEDGIKVGVEKVSNLYPNKNDKKKRGIAVTVSILGDMPKCRARVVDDNGQLVMKEDEETGEQAVDENGNLLWTTLSEPRYEFTEKG